MSFFSSEAENMKIPPNCIIKSLRINCHSISDNARWFESSCLRVTKKEVYVYCYLIVWLLSWWDILKYSEVVCFSQNQRVSSSYLNVHSVTPFNPPLIPVPSLPLSRNFAIAKTDIAWVRLSYHQFHKTSFGGVNWIVNNIVFENEN